MAVAKWDKKYAEAPEGLFGSAPNEYVREIAARSDFSARAVLCLADGDGRNSRYLAKLGLDVTAVDLSAVACTNGELLDREAGVRVARVVGDVVTWKPAGGQSWEAVFLMYLQAPFAVRMTAVQRGWDALQYGGLLVVEGFAKAQAAAGGDGALGPGSPDLMYDLDEIIDCLPDAAIIEAMSGRVLLDEGARHRGLAHVVRLAARKV